LFALAAIGRVAAADLTVDALRLAWKPEGEVARRLSVQTTIPPAPIAGTWIGPVLVEGETAVLLRQLPSGLLHSLALPVGVSPLFLPYGFGLAVYGRFGR
jgi:hypothetical protein